MKTQNTSNFYIESAELNKISQKDIEKIVEIEQDMWAREESLGEYVRCVECEKIHSKEEIFGHLSSHLRMLTVAKLEKIIPVNVMECGNCRGKVHSLFNRQEYLEHISERYKSHKTSFLTVMRDHQGEIRGFMDGYVDNIEKIYENEFAYYYQNIGLEYLKNKIGSLGLDTKKDILACSAIGMEEKYRSLYGIIDMEMMFFHSVREQQGEIDGIYELRLGTQIHALKILLGVQSLGLSLGENREKIINAKFQSDIFIQRNIANTTLHQNPGLLRKYIKSRRAQKIENHIIAA